MNNVPSPQRTCLRAAVLDGSEFALAASLILTSRRGLDRRPHDRDID